MAQATDNQSQPEVIEQAVSRKEAEYLADQYQLTYPDCKIWVMPDAPSEEEAAEFYIHKYLMPERKVA